MAIAFGERDVMNSEHSTAPPNTPPLHHSNSFLPPALLAGIVALAFLRCLAFPYSSYDDDFFILNNPFLQTVTWENLRQLWIPGSFARESLYIPVTYVSYFLEVALGGGFRPGLMHGTSLLLHVLNTLLVFQLFKRLGMRPFGAFAAGLGFALHPLQVEAVAWAMGRKDVLSATFALLCLIAYLRHLNTGKLRYWGWAFVASLLALLSKPSLIILPGLLILLECFKAFIPLQEISTAATQAPEPDKSLLRTLRQLTFRTAPFFVVAAGILAVNLNIPNQPVFKQDLLYSILSVPVVLGGWIRRFLLIEPIQHYYPWPARETLAHATLGGAAMLLGAGLLLAWIFLKQSKKAWLLFGTAFFSIAFLTPLALLRSIGPFITADRYGYFPLVGIFFLLGWLHQTLPYRFQKPYQIALFCWLGMAAVFGQTVLDHWKDKASIWATAVRHHPNNADIHYHLARACQDENKQDKAEQHYLRSLELDPGNRQATVNLGGLYYQQKNFAAAAACFEHATRYPAADLPHIYMNLALAHLQLGRSRPAIQALAKAIELNPDFSQARLLLDKIHRTPSEP